MRGSRLAGLIVLGVLAVTVALGIAGMGWAYGELPPPQGPRVRGDAGAVGIFGTLSYAWVLPSEHGVVLVDTGDLPSAKPLLDEIGTRKVQGILLTHAQADHVGGLAQFPDVPVWVAEEDAGYLDGSVAETSMLSRLFRPFGSGPPGRPKDLRTYVFGKDGAGEEVIVDGLAFLPVKVPGVTPGSTALLRGDTLYVGDAVWGGSPLRLPVEAFCEDPVAAKEQPKKLLALDFVSIADGHVGFTSAARPALFRLMGEPLAGPSSGPRTRRATPLRGWLVRADGPDARGEQPEWLAVPGRAPLRLSPRPVAARDALVDRWVEAVGVIEGDRLAVDSLGAIEGAPELPAPTGPALAKWAGRTVDLTGRVEGFEPHAAGAAWGAGELVLADGTRVSIDAPADAVTNGPGAVRGRVVVDDPGARDPGVRLVVTAKPAAAAP